MQVKRGPKSHSVKLDAFLDQKLSEISKRTRREKSFLLGLAVELALVEWKKNGIVARIG